MKVMKWSVIAMAVAAGTSQLAFASAQSESKGFVDDANLDLLMRNAYFHRDRKDGAEDLSRWGQGFIATFESGFTRGLVGVGVDAYGLLGVRLDKGESNVDGGIAFFDVDSDGEPYKDISKAGAAIKLRVSDTVLKYGDQMPSMPVLSHDTTRLLPQTFTGTLLTSREINNLELNVGHFTSVSHKNRAGRDVGAAGAYNGALNSIDVIGGSYSFNDNLSVALYYSDVEDVFKKKYANVNYAIPLSEEQSLAFGFNFYRTDYENDNIASDAFFGDGNLGDQNTIWSLAATYSVGAHAFIVAHQRSSGDVGYAYDLGDGGNAIYLANSFRSDFNYKNENSWQASYELDFSGFGAPGLFWKTAYIRGDNVDAGNGNDNGTEREIFNQVSYVFQSGPAKDLSLKLRNSILRSNFQSDENEIRVFIEYPLSIL